MSLLGVIPFWLQVAAGAAFLLFLYVLRRPASAKVLLAIGGGLLAIRARRADIDSDLGKVPDWVYLVLLVGGVVFAVIGIIGLVVPLRQVVTSVKEFVADILEKRFLCRAADSNELEKALVFSQSFFGDAHHRY